VSGRAAGLAGSDGQESVLGRPSRARPGRRGDLAVVNIRAVFVKAGLRCTRQREQVYAALASTKSHPTAEDLHTAIGGSEQGLSLATVYNTLEVFTKRGLCRRMIGPPGAAACRYDADLSEHAHVALPDGRLVDLPKDLSDRFTHPISADLIAEVEARMGVRVGRVAVQVICVPEGGPESDGEDSVAP
jgi:Fe2+ or Zn2+ uptake regulation protein